MSEIRAHAEGAEALFEGDPHWDEVRSTLRNARAGDAESLRNWLGGRAWIHGFMVYLVGSLIERKEARDLDVALCASGHALSMETAVTALTEVRRFGISQLGTRIDATVYPEPQEAVLRKAHGNRAFCAWKLRTRYWERRCEAGDTALTLTGGLVIIRRRLCETNYYRKLPYAQLGTSGGRRLRPGKLLIPNAP